MNSLDQLRFKTILATVAINILAVIAFAQMPNSDWRTGMYLNMFDNLILLGFIFWKQDRLLAQFLLFGLAVGLTELPADAWLVDVTHTLDYSIGGGPMIWRSPLWMPLAWEIVAVQFGVIGLFLMERFGWKGILSTGLLGALNIPFYEEMARQTKWWVYSGCRMISHTPYYIIVGEFLIAATLAWLARYLRREKIFISISSGIAGGVLIFLSYAVAFQLSERNF